MNQSCLKVYIYLIYLHTSISFAIQFLKRNWEEIPHIYVQKSGIILKKCVYTFDHNNIIQIFLAGQY